MTESRDFQIGEIYTMYFDGEANEQSGWRPGVVFQNNMGNTFSPNIISLPLTSRLKCLHLPTHVVLPSSIGLKRDSMVLCENPERMSKEKIGHYITKIPDNLMVQIAVGSLLASSAISYLDVDILMETWQKAKSLNSYCAA